MKPVVHFQENKGDFEEQCAELVDQGYKLVWVDYQDGGDERAPVFMQAVFALPEALPNTDILASIEAHLEAMAP